MRDIKKECEAAAACIEQGYVAVIGREGDKVRVRAYINGTQRDIAQIIKSIIADAIGSCDFTIPQLMQAVSNGIEQGQRRKEAALSENPN